MIYEAEPKFEIGCAVVAVTVVLPPPAVNRDGYGFEGIAK